VRKWRETRESRAWGSSCSRNGHFSPTSLISPNIRWILKTLVRFCSRDKRTRKSQLLILVCTAIQQFLSLSDMGQKRAAAPVFPFHFKDYGFFSLVVLHCFRSTVYALAAKIFMCNSCDLLTWFFIVSWRRSDHRRARHQPPPPESARFKLQKQI
jgi:hypothetical protein